MNKDIYSFGPCSICLINGDSKDKVLKNGKCLNCNNVDEGTFPNFFNELFNKIDKNE